MPVDPADQVDAGHDVAPLVVAAHLQPAALPLVQHQEVVGLQDLVVELDEGEAGLQAHLVGLEGEHAVDREVAPDLAQEVDVVQGSQPLGVVQHQRLALGEIEETGDLEAEALAVGPDRLVGQDLAHLGLARGVADARGAAADEGDGAVPRALQVGHGEQLQQVPHVQAGAGGIEADVEGDPLALHQLAQARLVGALGDETPLLQGLETGQGQPSSCTRPSPGGCGRAARCGARAPAPSSRGSAGSPCRPPWSARRW